MFQHPGELVLLNPWVTGNVSGLLVQGVQVKVNPEAGKIVFETQIDAAFDVPLLVLAHELDELRALKSEFVVPRRPTWQLSVIAKAVQAPY